MTETTNLVQSLVPLVEQRGRRDWMSGARQAMLSLPLDDGREMVVKATIHDRRRERIIVMFATGLCLASFVGAAITVGPALLHPTTSITNEH